MPDPLSENKHMSHAQERVLGFVEYCTATTSEGRPFYAFLRIPVSNYTSYRHKLGSGDLLDLTAYGDVIETGWGVEPPEDVQERIHELFGKDPDFEKKLALAKAAHKATKH